MNSDDREGHISPEIVEFLRTDGWFPERNVNIDHWVQLLESNHYLVTQEMKRILVSYGGLRLRTFIPHMNIRCHDWLIDPIAAIDFIEGWELEFWEQKLQARLTPIGVVDDLYVELVDLQGRIYGQIDGTLCFDGDSFEDAIENVIVVHRRSRPTVVDSKDFDPGYSPIDFEE